MRKGRDEEQVGEEWHGICYVCYRAYSTPAYQVSFSMIPQWYRIPFPTDITVIIPLSQLH